jgi:hypothetical protein
MEFDEQIAMRLAKDRMEEAVREADERRAARAGRGGRSLRARLGSALDRFSHWMRD